MKFSDAITVSDTRPGETQARPRGCGHPALPLPGVKGRVRTWHLEYCHPKDSRFQILKQATLQTVPD